MFTCLLYNYFNEGEESTKIQNKTNRTTESSTKVNKCRRHKLTKIRRRETDVCIAHKFTEYPRCVTITRFVSHLTAEHLCLSISNHFV